MLQDFFAAHPVFTAKEFASHLRCPKKRSRWTEKALLAYHVKRQHITRVRRGLYVTLAAGNTCDSQPIDPYLLTARMSDDAVLAYHTALEFHGRAYSAFQRFHYLTASNARPVTFRDNRFQPVKFPRRLRVKHKTTFGVLQRERAGLPVRVTSFERALVDALDRLDLCGGWEEAWRSLESIEFFDLDQVIKYSLMLGNATTTAKVGFFLEQHRQALAVEDSHLRRLRKNRPSGPHYAAERNGKRPVRFLSQWNLVVPEQVVERAWEEVS